MYLPDTHTETSPGVYERIEQGNSKSEEIQESYRVRAEKILKLDQRHYRKHAPGIRQEIEAAGIPLSFCIAWAGGHPKMEAQVGFDSIQVVDAIAKDYQETDGIFQELYGPAKVEYCQTDIDASLVAEAQTLTEPFANTFAHFLEHLTADTTRELLGVIAEGGKPIIIYGPNIEKATDDKWIHFRPADHNTFFTAGAFVSLLEGLGYSYVKAKEIDEDYLIIASNYV